MKFKTIIIIAAVLLALITVGYYFISKKFIYCPESIHSYGFAVDKNTVIFIPFEHQNNITRLDLRSGTRSKLAVTPTININYVLQVTDTKFILFQDKNTYIYNYTTDKFKKIDYINYQGKL